MKNKILKRVAALAVCGAMLAPAAFAACTGEKTPDNLLDGVMYELMEDGTGYMITGTSGMKATELTIPATYKELPVKEITEKAFMGCKTLESISVPDSVTEIGAAAFKGCKSLKDLTIPFVGTSAAAEGEEALFGYMFGNKAFSNATKIYQVTADDEYKAYIPNDLTRVTVTGNAAIKYGAFSACENLEEMVITSASAVEDNAFMDCEMLSSVYIGSAAVASAITSQEACGGLCSMANSIFVAESVTTVGSYITNTLDVLDKTVTVGGAVYKAYGAYEQGGIFFRKNAEHYEVVGLSEDFEGTEVTLPATVRDLPVTTIRAMAFANAGITSITVPANVTEVGKDAFKGCSKLAKIYLESETIANATTGNADFGGLFYYATDVLIPTAMEPPEIFTKLFNNTEEEAETVGSVKYNRYFGEEIWVRMEAEYAILSGTPNDTSIMAFVRGNGMCSNGQYVGNMNVLGNSVKYIVTSSVAVRAKVAIRISSCQNPGGNISVGLNNMYRLTVNGVTPEGYDSVVVEPSEFGKQPGGSYVDFVTSMFEIDLVEGENVIILDAGTITNNLDYIELVTMARLTWTPTQNPYRQDD